MKLPRRVFFIALIVVLLIIPIPFILNKAPRKKEPVNVILIVVDTLRADQLGFMGGPNISPNIDRLSRDSIVFQNAISPAPWTSPAVGSILTGRDPSALGFLSDEFSKLDRSVITLAEILKLSGYRSFGVVSHLLLETQFGFSQGFDSYDESNSRGESHVSSESITEKAAGILQNAGKPFLLFLHYFDPHFSYIMHDKYNYDKEYKGAIDNDTTVYEMRRMSPRMSQADVDHIWAKYRSEISFTDEYIGKLLQTLKEMKLYDSSLIIFVGDHGESIRERKDGWIGHTQTLYQELVHVPLLIKLPGSEQGFSVSQYVSTKQITPTIVDYLQLDVPENLDFGGMALNLERKTEQPMQPVMSETSRHAYLRSIVWNHWKLIYSPKTGDKMLFDLKSDPKESNNLADIHSEMAKLLEQKLVDYYAKNDGSKGGAAGQAPDLTDREKQILKSLGYF